jgi:C1A family cysteine protease
MKKGFRFKWNRRFWKERGLGALPNPADKRDMLYEPDGEISYPLEVSLEKYVKVVDQGGTSSCVGNAVAGAVWIMEVKSEKEYGYPSRMFLYWNSRNQHGVPPFSDNGTYVRSCCKALGKIGVPDETQWPFKAKKVNTQPSFGTWGKADPRKGGEYLSIAVGGKERVNLICKAISDGYPVVFGTPVAKSFMPAEGPELFDIPADEDPIVGGHAMVVVGYRTIGENVRFRILNSWGPYWRDNGLCWFTEDYIRWSQSNDFTIVRGWRRLEA